MKIINDIRQWHAIRKDISQNKSIGFIPTMGALHVGHGSLISTSTRENDLTVVSIFVNPTQFNKESDYANYPNTLENDLTYLQTLNVDYCIVPEKEAMYADNFQFQMDEKSQSLNMEGKHRPGHFTGVLTIVMKLLNIVKPHNAYFGEKDYQQYRLIHDMADAFFLGVKIRSCPTMREPSGLALSSRNRRLTEAQLQIANQFAFIFHNNETVTDINEKLTALDITIEYIEDYNNRRFAAVQIGDIRLIDNYSLI